MKYKESHNYVELGESQVVQKGSHHDPGLWKRMGMAFPSQPSIATFSSSLSTKVWQAVYATKLN